MPTPAVQLTNVQDALRVVTDNAVKFQKGASDLTLRNHKILRMIYKYGRAMFNCRDYAYVWQCKVRKPPIRQKHNGQRVVYMSNTTDEQFSIDIRGYEGTDMMEEKEYIVNQNNPLAIVNRYSRILDDLKQAFDEHIAENFYLNANDPQYSSCYHGVGTILGRDTSVAVTAADRVAAPGGSYAGQDTKLGWFGGSWQAGAHTYNAALGNSWPFGKGSSEYDAASPVLANYTSNAWGSGSTAFQDNIELVISFLMSVIPSRTGYENLVGAPIIMMLDPALFDQAKNHFRDRNRQLVPVSAANDFGIPAESLNIDGMWVCPDYAMGNSGEGVVLLPQYMEMCNAHSDLYKFRGPEWSFADAAYLLYGSAYGNFRFQPKYFAKIGAYA